MENKKLIDLAKKKAKKIKEAEIQLEKAKDEFHQSIRRMHVEGMSYREIASTVNLSHQRVHQIIDAQKSSGLKWIPDAGKKLACSFCKGTSEQVAKLVAGPNVYICDECTKNCASVLDSRKSLKSKKNKCKLVAESEDKRCSFCGNQSGGKREIVSSKRSQICNQCLELTITVIAEAK